ncbi:Manganese/iron superoxide dismutase [Myxozyma melibiosi]|uniref:Manganese/iron superoxide dismutase n=1 Tax=Myxozyma melibiosi TaxID=54550 RepID=A0ABR1F5P5_9ASCO
MSAARSSFFSTLRSGVASTGTRPQVSCRPLASNISSLRQAAAAIHTKPVLLDEGKFRQNGIEPLYSAKGFDLAWTKYQEYLCNELTKATAGTKYDGISPFDTLLATARYPEETVLFNWSSLAHNNHFFFHTLKGPSSKDSTGPLPALSRAIDLHFTGVEELKDHMSGIARSMCGNGFVWLVEGPNKQLFVTATYNSGTPYDDAHGMNVDMNGPVSEATRNSVRENEAMLRQRAKRRPDWPLPLLCINVWEHAYLTDYGFEGKEEYFENWWKSIDWHKVEERFSSVSVFNEAKEGRASL